MRITKMRAMLFLLGMAAILSDGTGEGLAKALMGTLLVFGPMVWAVYLLSSGNEAVSVSQWMPPEHHDGWHRERADIHGEGFEPYPVYYNMEEGRTQPHEGPGYFRIN